MIATIKNKINFSWVYIGNGTVSARQWSKTELDFYTNFRTLAQSENFIYLPIKTNHLGPP